MANLQTTAGWLGDLQGPAISRDRDEGLSPFGWLPLSNPRALVAYYLGVFAMVPVLGLPLAAAAIWQGLDGLGDSALREGRGHSRAGIALGGLSLAVHFALALWLTFALAPLAG